ncbi:MAG: N-acetylneuraminate synthase family protein [Candidatus Omnitrophota bacterium]
MARKVRIGNRWVGEKESVFVVAEIGINHNGDLQLVKALVDAAKDAGADAVKFQKRTVELVYTPEELARPRENPFGPTNGDLKRGLELDFEEYLEIDRYCKEKEILWFASSWDERSVDFIAHFDVPCYKIASALLTHDALLRCHQTKRKPIILSTGMSTMEEIRHAVDILGLDDLILLHCTSTYPSKPEELNLQMIQTLKNEFDCPIGYSGHEVGLATTIAAATLGARLIERHITLDRSMWGSDQAASVEPQGFKHLVKDIRLIEKARGDGVKQVYESERPILEKLRRS